MEQLPPDLMFEQEAIKRKRAVAEMLMQQSMQPVEAPVVKGRFQGSISPFAGMAKMLQTYNAQSGIADADKAGAGIADKYRSGLAEAVAKYAAGSKGTPEIPMPSDELGGGPGAPAMAGDPRKAIIEAMSSPYAPVQRIAQMDLTQMNRKEDRADTQSFQRDQLKMQLEARAQDIKDKAAEGRISKEEADARMAELRVQMQNAGFENQRTMAGIAAGLRQPREAPAPVVTEIMRDGKLVKIDARSGALIGEAPPRAGKGAAPLSATAQRELFEADDVSNSAANAVEILKSIISVDPKTKKSQNDVAFGGGFGDLRTKAMGMVPGNYEGENASVDLKNKVTGQALENLKAIFGGMPTEGERKVLMEMQGSLDQTPAQRKLIFDRAIVLAERRQKLAQDKAKRLRDGTYFGSGVATNQDGNPAPAEWAIVR